MQTLRLSNLDPFTKRIFKLTYPAYRGRTFKIAVYEDDAEHDWNSYWSGGSRDYFTFVKLDTMELMVAPQNGTPFDRASYHGPLPPGVVAVRHSIFCGKDAGLTIIARASDITPALTTSITSAMVAK